MLKKFVFGLAMLSLLVLSVQARAPKQSITDRNLEKITQFVDEAGYLHKIVYKPGVAVIDTVQYLGDIVITANNYTAGGDYVATYFRPAADGFITDVFMPFGTTGDCEFHVMRDTLVTNAAGSLRSFCNWNNCVVDSINGFVGSKIWSVTKATAVSTATLLTEEEYEHLNIKADVTMGLSDIPVVEYYRVWVGFKKLTTGATNELWARSYDYGYTGDYIGHTSFSYNQNWANPLAGPYSIIWGSNYQGDCPMKVVFTYPEGTPPQVLSMDYVANTYSTTPSKNVWASLADADGSVTSAQVVFGVGYAMTTTSRVDMTYNEDYDEWYGTVSGTFAPGDSVYYYVEATDNESKVRDNSLQKKYFVVKAPADPTSEIMVILESEDDFSVYSTVLDRLGKTYEVWDVDENNGIDASVVSLPQIKYIVWGAHGTGKFAYPEFDKEFLSGISSLYAGIFDFLDNGGGLFMSDYDYFYTRTFGGVDTTMVLGANECSVNIGELEPGSIGYDYFGVGKWWSDPFYVSDDYHPQGELSFAGVASDPITNNWATTDLNAIDQTEHWGDFIEVAPGAEAILLGKAHGYQQGVRKSNGTWATVFIPWNFAILADTTGGANTSTDAEQFMANVLGYLAAKTTGVEDDPFFVNPLRTELLGNYPNPFNPETEIAFSLAEAGNVKISIYDLTGKLVRKLIDEEKSVGTYKVRWNGTRANGQPVGTGMYLYKLETGTKVQSKKMMFIK